MRTTPCDPTCQSVEMFMNVSSGETQRQGQRAEYRADRRDPPADELAAAEDHAGDRKQRVAVADVGIGRRGDAEQGEPPSTASSRRRARIDAGLDASSDQPARRSRARCRRRRAGARRSEVRISRASACPATTTRRNQLAGTAQGGGLHAHDRCSHCGALPPGRRQQQHAPGRTRRSTCRASRRSRAEARLDQGAERRRRPSTQPSSTPTPNNGDHIQPGRRRRRRRSRQSANRKIVVVDRDHQHLRQSREAIGTARFSSSVRPK